MCVVSSFGAKMTITLESAFKHGALAPKSEFVFKHGAFAPHTHTRTHTYTRTHTQINKHNRCGSGGPVIAAYAHTETQTHRHNVYMRI